MGRLKLWHVIAAWIIGGLGFVFPLMQDVSDPDIWWQLKTGELIWANKSVPTVDPFSFTTSGIRWTDHEWLSQVIFYKVFAIGGLIGLAVMKAVLVCALIAGIYFLVRRYTKHSLAVLTITTLCALVTWRFWNTRPHLFSFVLLVGLLILLDRSRQSGKAPWLAVPMFLVWSNLHGGWAFGFVLMALVLIESAISAIRQGKTRDAALMGGVIVCSLLAVLIGPSPVGRLLYPLGYFWGHIPTKLVIEFRGPNFRSIPLFPYDFLLLLIPVVIFLGRKRMPISNWVMLAVTIVLSLRSVRQVPLLGLVAAPVLAVQINAILERWAQKDRLRWLLKDPQGYWPANLLLLLIIPVLAFMKAPRDNSEYAMVRWAYPADACQFLLDEPVRGEGRLLNTYDWGGYLIYKLYPNYKVSIDGRADLHYADMTSAVNDFEGMSPNWKTYVENLNPDVILLPVGKTVADALREDPNWLVIYEDEVAVVFAREE